MATEAIIAGIGLVISAASAGYSIYSSEQAAKEAESIADDNARREQMEAEEMAQRAEKEAAREESLARAQAFASGVGGESTDIYLRDLNRTNRREIDWIRKSGLSSASITRREGDYAASTLRRQGVSDAIQFTGQAASYGVDWYNASPKKPAASFDASADHKSMNW